MRTTVTLDPDVAALVRKRMRERDQSFKQALNEAIREGLVRHESAAGPIAYETPTYDLGGARVSLDHALRLAASLEDDERLATSSQRT